MPSNEQVEKVSDTIDKFIIWLNNFGETSYDHQSYFASSIGNYLKSLYYNNKIIGTIAVSPMILSEAFVPSARQLFWKKQRFPIADAHYAMGFALLASVYQKDDYYQKAKHYLNILLQTRAPGYKYYGWGYPFNWQTRTGVFPANTPFITTLPYVYEAFLYVYRIDKDQNWLNVMDSIVKHAITDYKDFDISSQSSSCSYSPVLDDKGGVINASAYRAFLLTHASDLFSEKKYWDIAERNLNFVLETQQPDGSWFYAADSVRDFVDHFHTCFIMKALSKIVRLKQHNQSINAINKGAEYYINNLLDEKDLPKPFSKAPRLTVYKKELYDYAESINLGILLQDTFTNMVLIVSNIINDIMQNWIKKDGSFRSRKLLLGWDNVPMHRWAQAQLFRSLCLYLAKDKQDISKITL